MERMTTTYLTRDDAEPVLLCSNTYDDLTGYHYQVKDYRGDVRAVVTQNGMLEETNSYYPYGMLHGISAIASTQPYKYTGKELDRENGLDWHDFEARFQMPSLGRTTTIDPLAEKYYSISPYAWCAGNPIKHVDPNGKKVHLYTTTLPGASKLLHPATHSFIVVTDEQNKVRGYFAYGSEYNGLDGAFCGRLMRREYKQDKDVYSGKDRESLKKEFIISPPKGVSQTDFDNTVIRVAKSFGNNPGIRYKVIPTKPTEGNCNTSTSTILLKSGVSPEEIEKIEDNIPGINTGVDSYERPWTKEEQAKAVEYERKVQEIDKQLNRTRSSSH